MLRLFFSALTSPARLLILALQCRQTANGIALCSPSAANLARMQSGIHALSIISKLWGVRICKYRIRILDNQFASLAKFHDFDRCISVSVEKAALFGASEAERSIALASILVHETCHCYIFSKRKLILPMRAEERLCYGAQLRFLKRTGEASPLLKELIQHVALMYEKNSANIVLDK